MDIKIGNKWHRAELDDGGPSDTIILVDGECRHYVIEETVKRDENGDISQGTLEELLTSAVEYHVEICNEMDERKDKQ